MPLRSSNSTLMVRLNLITRLQLALLFEMVMEILFWLPLQILVMQMFWLHIQVMTLHEGLRQVLCNGYDTIYVECDLQLMIHNSQLLVIVLKSGSLMSSKKKIFLQMLLLIQVMNMTLSSLGEDLVSISSPNSSFRPDWCWLLNEIYVVTFFSFQKMGFMFFF